MSIKSYIQTNEQKMIGTLEVLARHLSSRGWEINAIKACHISKLFRGSGGLKHARISFRSKRPLVHHVHPTGRKKTQFLANCFQFLRHNIILYPWEYCFDLYTEWHKGLPPLKRAQRKKKVCSKCRLVLKVALMFGPYDPADVVILQVSLMGKDVLKSLL